MTTAYRVLTIGHSYCVRRNRELAEALVVCGQAEPGGRPWEITVAAPAAFPGDLGPIMTRRDAAERADLRVLPVHNARWIHLMTYGAGIRALLREPWDVIHCWEEPYTLSAAQVARVHHVDAALVYASFQNINKQYPPPFGAVERYAMQRARGWIGFGESVSAVLLQRRGYVERAHTVIPFGVDVQRFTPSVDARHAMHAALDWDDAGPLVIGFVGRFIAAKGLPLLLDVLDALHRQGTDWRGLFVGGGPLEATVRAFGARHPDRVRIATGVTHDDVPRYMQAMDVLVAPSETTPRWREQFGRMIVEAMACGVAVVGSDSGEIPFVVGSAGLIVQEGDRNAWTMALATLLGDATATRELGALGRARAETTFAWPVIARRHFEFFQRIVTT